MNYLTLSYEEILLFYKNIITFFESNKVMYFHLNIGRFKGKAAPYRTTFERKGLRKSWNYESCKSSRGGGTETSSIKARIFTGRK